MPAAPTRRALSLRRSPAGDRRRGSVLVAVLGLVFLLTLIVTQFVEEVVDDLHYRALFNEPPEVRAFAYSMLEVSLATLHEIALIDDGALYAPEQGWADPISYAGIPIPNGWEVAVVIVDESARLPINRMGEGELNQLLEDSFEFDFGTARELSSTLLDWIDADDQMRLNGAESAQYLRRNPPYRATNAPLQTLGELRLLEGWGELFFTEDGSPNEAFQRLEAMVSVVNGDSVNLNSSTEPTLRHLSPGEGDDFERLFDGLRDEPYLKTVPGSLQSNRAGVTAELLRITITVRRGEVPFNLSALVEPNIGAEAGPAPAVRSDDQPRTGAPSEQEAIAYPFTILQLSEHEGASPPAAPARYSALDIEKQSDSF